MPAEMALSGTVSDLPDGAFRLDDLDLLLPSPAPASGMYQRCEALISPKPVV